jgi:Protein of unknown function (DUF1573)/Secretion system C-terminal sorting domain
LVASQLKKLKRNLQHTFQFFRVIILTFYFLTTKNNIMKIYLHPLSLSFSLLFLANVLFAQQTDLITEGEVLEQPSNAIMTFDESTFDWGSIKEGEKILTVFTFSNTGTDPLLLSNVKGSCGCTISNWPKDPIAPGEDGEIVVVFDSKGKKDLQSKRVTITANTVPIQTYLVIKGNVIAAETATNPTMPVATPQERAQEPTEARLLARGITLYPNPSSDLIQIDLKSLIGKSVSIGIFSDTGKRLNTKELAKVEEDSLSFDLSSFATGQYFVSILVDNSERITKPFSIVR